LTIRSPWISDSTDGPGPAGSSGKTPMKAMPKNTTVSTIEPSAEPAKGACHQGARRRRSNTTMSSNWPTRNAVPEATAIRHGASSSEAATPAAKPA
jgi:hypothetical protein